ncbi:ATP-binding cassette domain-containing protein [Microbacterium sp. ARD31]|uniref:ATP-binding cassette domain-containing protein n=1 Tax=Microbacterium sp. ARD31 TaxID=2962576 RepID=UPI002882B42A|nr:ATP-binding cassette domain-containing protein [Microbacterium sp. ARD31]MDT0182143.1 ATP-binding cassette domain-containing protein [Microbacterium sp. ARD31]
MSITATDVSYAFGRKEVLHNISISFDAGATLLLGPNGAGKSTTLEVLASLRRPQAGDTEIAGVGKPGPKRRQLASYRAALSWLPQTFVPYPGLKVREQVALAGWLKGMSRTDAWDKASRALEHVTLKEKEAEPVKSLSGGQLRRLGIAGALVHDARVILMDEPTAGLDISQRQRFHSLITEIGASRTVVVSSHDTEDALSHYDSVAVLHAGRIIFNGTSGDFVEGTDPSARPADRFQKAYESFVGVSE